MRKLNAVMLAGTLAALCGCSTSPVTFKSSSVPVPAQGYTVTGSDVTGTSDQIWVFGMGGSLSAQQHKAYKTALGSAGILMGSRAAGADVVFAWENAKIGAMDAKAAGKILAAGQDAAAMRKAAASYEELQNSSASAAARGCVDTIISEADTRKFVIGAFEMLYSKREERPDKKHGTI